MGVLLQWYRHTGMLMYLFKKPTDMEFLIKKKNSHQIHNYTLNMNINHQHSAASLNQSSALSHLLRMIIIKCLSVS